MQTTLENILSNPFVNHFVDCIENLPNNLQFLLSELRNIDAQVNAYHRKLNNFKENYKSETNADDEIKIKDEINGMNDSEQLNNLHKTLIKCQELGDQKVVLVSRIIDLINAKTKQLILDAKSLDNQVFKMDLNEDKVISEFKATIKKRYLFHNTHMSISNQTTLQLGSNSTSGTGKNYNLVTKAMSKYMSTSTHYEQNGVNNSSSSNSNKNDYRLVNSCSKILRQQQQQTSQQQQQQQQQQKYSSSTKSNNNSAYQLPDRRAKKPRIDFEQKSTPNNQSTITRSKRQLQYTPQQQTKTSLNQSVAAKTLNSIKKKRLLQHQSSPSSQSTCSSSSNSTKHVHNQRQSRLASLKQKHKLNDDDDMDDDDDSSTNNNHNHNNNNNINNNQENDDNNNQNDKNLNDLSDISNDDIPQNDVCNNAASTQSLENSPKHNVLTTIHNIEPNEPVYCTCQQVSYGQMIMCDNGECDLEWFHFDCVGLQSKPKGKWYCPNCRGDTHKVMRKTNNQNTASYRK